VTILSFPELMKRRRLLQGDETIGRDIDAALAEFLDARISPGSVTLETGAGLSTLVILRTQPRRHTAVHPSAEAFAAILEFAVRQGIDTRGFLPVLARSQDWLPGAELPELDLVLVGGAPFPVPLIDWYFAAERLKAGGLMVVEGTQQATGTMLADFMQADPGWEPVARSGASQFASYRKRSPSVSDPERQPGNER
jgi:hypothetical protein